MDQPLSRRDVPLKRKRVVLTLEEKLEVIQLRDSGKKLNV
jgi:CENP-B N-terminal DNA-binding domain